MQFRQLRTWIAVFAALVWVFALTASADDLRPRGDLRSLLRPVDELVSPAFDSYGSEVVGDSHQRAAKTTVRLADDRAVIVRLITLGT